MNGDEITALLYSTFLFAGTSGTVEAALSSGAHEVKHYAKHQIILPDPGGAYLYVMTYGAARVYAREASVGSSDADKDALNTNGVALRELNTGDVFGAAYLFGGEPQTTIIALTECGAVTLGESAVVAAIEKDAAVAVNYIRFLAGRVGFLNKKIAAFTAGSAEARLAVYLLSLPRLNGEITLPCTTSALAGMLDIGRASLYRAFDRLAADGAITHNGRKIRVLSDEILKNSYK